MTDLADVFKWMAGRDTGMSSRAIAMHMSSGYCDGAYPHDPADLGRCLRLLERFPEWKSRIVEMRQYNAAWRLYADNWDILSSSMAEEVGIDWSKGGRAEKTYALMKEIRTAARASQIRKDEEA